MNLLLDTHVLLWWLDNNPALSREARDKIGRGESAVFVSAVSVWEIVIKKGIGKLRAPGNLERELVKHRFQPLPISLAHALAIEGLPDYHTDPFDRMLVAQAQVEGFTLVTRDARIQKYPVEVIRA